MEAVLGVITNADTRKEVSLYLYVDFYDEKLPIYVMVNITFILYKRSTLYSETETDPV